METAAHNTLSRRHFLRQALTAGAALSLMGCAALQGRAPAEPLGWHGIAQEVAYDDKPVPFKHGNRPFAPPNGLRFAAWFHERHA